VVVPIFNEEESLPTLHREVAEVLGPLGLTWELILVDDGSTDGSLSTMLALRSADPHVRVVKFRRNCGQTAALAAGFEFSRGDVVVAMDGDLQNDPADIPRLLDKLEEGYDVVAGWRKKRFDGFLLRTLPSIVANRLIALVTGVSIHDTGCTLKAFQRELVKKLPLYAEQHRFLPVMSAGSGARVTELVVNHRARRFGQSKYGIGRAIRVLLDLFTVKMLSQFTQRPLHYFGLLSLLFLGLGTLFAVASFWDFGKPTQVRLSNWEQSIVTTSLLFFMVTVYFALLGLLAELAVKASGMHRRGTLSRILNELHG
jgi:glycosyltransferase involved in cell wall biosynthesis